MGYRGEIDGLRAIAVLAVIFFHAGFKVFEGGFVGVDVFFVISGYLITTIILADMNEGKFSIAKFYERRARRILPALFLVMLCCLPFAWLWLLPNHLKDFCKSLTSISTFSSNILFMKESGYFATQAELKPLLHAWSLSVEEQYYILFPLFLIALWKLRKRWIFGSLLAIAVVSLIAAQWGTYHKPWETFYSLLTRGWELAIGALIAFYFLYKKEQGEFISSNKVASEALGLFGLVLICYSVFAFDKSTPFPGLYALVPTIGTALIIAFSTSATIAGRFLSTRILVGLGLISYSAYLWHHPLFVFARHRSLTEPGTALFLVLTVLSFVLAYCSWRFVEKPFRDKNAVSRKTVFKFAVAGSLVFIAIGVAGEINNGFDKRTNDGGIVLADLSKKIIINHGLSDDCDEKFTLSKNCRTSDEPEILVWGDSYASHLIQGILSSNPQAKIIQMTKSSCGPFFDIAPVSYRSTINEARDCVEFNNSVRDWLKSNNTVKYVVISAALSGYLGNNKNQLLIKDKVYDADKELFTGYFIKTMDELKNMGITPVIFSPIPQNGKNIGECLVRMEYFGGDLNACDFNLDEKTEASRKVHEFLKNISKNNKVVFLDDGVCSDSKCKTYIDNTYIFRDKTHFSQSGSALVGKKMDFYDLIVGNK